MVAVGLLTTVCFAVIGLPLALSLGVIAAILSFVPFMGPLLSAFPALMVALPHGPGQIATVVAVCVCVQLVDNAFIESFNGRLRDE